MPLTAGARLGPYEITAQIGAGGMGEVYRAIDTNLGRHVAIKVLPELFANDRERMARFEREARTLAALNHPNIAQIFGFEQVVGGRAIVMELVDGPTLADRIAQGPIPHDEALPVARQIAGALEAAHELGIVHRDLKPANIKLRTDGVVKVLDYGLAKALDPSPSGGAGATQSPTITSPAMTGVGVLLGTAAYMSPEQARGRPVDRRTDIWAFGCVLYEMLTGKRAFEGEDVSLTLSQILQREPAFDTLPADVPMRVRQAVRLCLRKSLKERMTDIGAVRLMLDGAFETTAAAALPNRSAAQSTWRRALPFFLTAAAAASLAGFAVWQLEPDRDSGARPVVRFSLPASPSVAPRGGGVGRHVLAISPQGTHLVYWADNQLHLRLLDRLGEGGAIRGSENAREPFFSPDGRWIGFHDQALVRMPVEGGARISLGTARNPWGVSWDSDGVIRYGQGPEGIWQVSATSGATTQLIAVEPGELAHGPQLLPGGDWLLFTFRPAAVDSWDQAQIVAQSLSSRERIVLVEAGRDARYVPTGHLVYGSNGALFGVPFDVRQRRITGPAVPLVEGVMDADVRTGAMHFTVSNDGTLVYLSGPSSQRGATLSWVNRNGGRDQLPAETMPYSSARISPDGSRVAVEVTSRDGVDIHIYDLGRKTLTRLTSGSGRGRSPLWTPDGQRVVFYSESDGGGLYSIVADGTGQLRRLTTSLALQTPYSWADGGATLVFEQRSIDRIGGVNLFRLSLAGKLTTTPLLEGAGSQKTEPIVSPDGRWLAYTEISSGGADVFVRPFPNVDDGRWRISTGGFSHAPLWSPDGKHVFYISNGRAMSVSIQTAPTFRPGTPTVAFDLPPFYNSSLSNIGRQWDIAPDGERFLILNPGDNPTNGDPASRMVVVLNWHDELKRLAPAK